MKTSVFFFVSDLIFGDILLHTYILWCTVLHIHSPYLLFREWHSTCTQSVRCIPQLWGQTVFVEWLVSNCTFTDCVKLYLSAVRVKLYFQWWQFNCIFGHGSQTIFSVMGVKLYTFLFSPPARLAKLVAEICEVRFWPFRPLLGIVVRIGRGLRCKSWKNVTTLAYFIVFRHTFAIKNCSNP